MMYVELNVFAKKNCKQNPTYFVFEGIFLFLQIKFS